MFAAPYRKTININIIIIQSVYYSDCVTVTMSAEETKDHTLHLTFLLFKVECVLLNFFSRHSNRYTI